MKDRARVTMVLLALAAASLIASGGCGEHAKIERPISIKVAILPEYSLPVMMARYAPLIARMQEALGPRYRVEWVSCPSPETFLATVENERPSISIQDAYHTSLLQKLQEASPVLQAVDREGRPMTRGAMITREGSSPLEPGARVAIPSRRSFLYVSQAYETTETLIDPATKPRFVPVRWQDEVVAQVRSGATEAGIVTEEAVEPGVRVVARTSPTPSACVVVFPQANGVTASQICMALARLSMDDPRDSVILEKLGIGGFVGIDRAGADRIRLLADRYATPY
jgi:ABC-type phosphate/phosphonate transport system substrate-binding protein